MGEKPETVADTEINETSSSAKAGKYLTFELGKETFGIEILKVQEIIGIMNVTHVPKTPDFIRGVINLRGKVIPVIDLRIKFGLPAKEDSEKTCVIVIQIFYNNCTIIMGIIVDEVREVSEIAQEEIEDPPSFGAAIDIEFIMGMGKINNNVVMLLDVDKVLSVGEVDNIAKLAKK